MNYTYKYADMSTQEIGQSFHEDIESALHRYYDPSPDPGKISPDFYDIAPDTSCISNAVKVLRSILDTMDDMDAALRSRPAHTFADIIAKYGLAHSTGAWDNDARFMVERLGYGLFDMIAYRDDVFSYLLSHGFPEEDAWDGMERVRRGHELPVVTSEMSMACGKWVIDRCKRVE